MVQKFILDLTKQIEEYQNRRDDLKILIECEKTEGNKS